MARGNKKERHRKSIIPKLVYLNELERECRIDTSGDGTEIRVHDFAGLERVCGTGPGAVVHENGITY